MKDAPQDAIRVLVVDDSALMRNLISRIIDAEKDLVVAATAMNGEFALKKIPRIEPDCIILDLEMPVMTGIEFLTERRNRNIEIPVVILSSIAQKGAKITMDALSLGATDFITKPSGSVSHDIHVVGEQLVALIRGYGGSYRKRNGLKTRSAPVDHAIRPFRSGPNGDQPPPAPSRPIDAPSLTPKAKPATLEAIAIGISTGGPNALRRVLAEIDADIGVPILVVQHMPAGFTAEFALSLDRVSPLEVKEAADGDILAPNRVLIAPGDYHLEVKRRKLATTVHLNRQEPVNGHRPSVGVLFRSVTAAFGNAALAVIMTGMGRDGAHEIGGIYEAGGITIGQNEETSVVYGMPRIAFENGYLTRQAALNEIASVLNSYAKELAGA